MNQRARWVLWLLACNVLACAKKEPKPMRTEPWLARPSASPSAAASGDAQPALTRYVIVAPSVLRWEAVARGPSARGALTRLSGEVTVAHADLPRSRARVQADLTAITVDGPDADSSARLLPQIRRALELDEGGSSVASFELTALEDLPSELDEPRRTSGSAPAARRLRATAVGNLLLHGFRVQRRLAIESEFGVADGAGGTETLVIRSRAPLVISLETHALSLKTLEASAKASAGATSGPREVRVSVELYATKSKDRAPD